MKPIKILFAAFAFTALAVPSLRAEPPALGTPWSLSVNTLVCFRGDALEFIFGSKEKSPEIIKLRTEIVVRITVNGKRVCTRTTLNDARVVTFIPDAHTEVGVVETSANIVFKAWSLHGPLKFEGALTQEFREGKESWVLWYELIGQEL